jgi:hypothetical protein
MAEPDDPEGVIPFPFSRSGVSKHKDAPRNLGLTKMSASVKSSGRGAKGHWCSSCKGIWYTHFFEVECPVCGKRG